MMRDDDNPPDMEPPSKASSPPSVKISRDISRTVVLVVITIAATALVIVDKCPVVVWAMLASHVLGSIAGGSKPEGAIGEQTLERLLKR